MKTRMSREIGLHLVLLVFAALTLTPLAFTINNSFRTNPEMDHNFFGVPDAFKGLVKAAKAVVVRDETPLPFVDGEGVTRDGSAGEAARHFGNMATRGYRSAWSVLRRYMLNSFVVSVTTACAVTVLGSISAYVLSRYRFPGSKAAFSYIIATMMFPAVLTLVPSFLLVKKLGLLNTYWALILPYCAGGQALATFVFKSFFDGLPEDLFEAARIDGAGHMGIYLNVILPLSKPVVAVVMIMSVLVTWNNFLWPFITNTDNRRHVIASGLFVLANSGSATNYSTVFAAYVLSSIPLLILFMYATKPFIQGVTSGAFKA